MRVIGWPRGSASCDFQRPLRFEEEVEIHLLVAEVRSRSLRYEFVFRKSDDGGGGYVVVDLGSTNGTKVNGVKVGGRGVGRRGAPAAGL